MAGVWKGTQQLFIGLITHLRPHSFHTIMYLYLVHTMCCDITISQHKRNTNIQELHILPNTLLVLTTKSYWGCGESL